jgi:hypothetical protein
MDFIFDPDTADTDIFHAGPCGTFQRVAPIGSLKFAAPASFPLIPRAEWPDRIADMKREKSRLSDIIADAGIPCLNQEQTKYCHGNSPALAIMALRAVQNQPFVLLSPASIAGPVTGFRNEGAFIAEDLQQIVDVGCASQEYVPANQIGRSGFRDGWEQDAAKHRVSEWWDLQRGDHLMFDRCMTLLLSRQPICVAYDFWGHAVTLVDPEQLDNGYFAVRFRNSWGEGWGENGYALLQEGKGTPSEAYCPRSTTVSA